MSNVQAQGRGAALSPGVQRLQGAALSAGLGVAMESLLVFTLGAAAILIVVWHMVQLIHYLGWRGYDIEYGTEYRFNEGAPEDWVFRVPPWLERLLRRLERDTKLGAKLRRPEGRSQ